MFATVSEYKLEQMMQTAQEARKDFMRRRGQWYWFYMDDEDDETGPFHTFLAALKNAVKPHLRLPT